MIKEFLTILTNLIFPAKITCDLCGKETFDGTNLCADCKKKVLFNDGITCPICGRRTEVEGVCFECKAHAPSYDKAVSAIVYKDGGAALVVKYKRGAAYLKDYFADLLKEKCSIFPLADGVCYIPMTAKAQRKRGYNQAELIAAELAKKLELPLLSALTKVRDTKAQKELNKTQREKNLKGSFRADRKLVEGRTLILVDDVMTTGTTAEEASKALKKAGAERVYFASAASVEYKREI